MLPQTVPFSCQHVHTYTRKNGIVWRFVITWNFVLFKADCNRSQHSVLSTSYTGLAITASTPSLLSVRLAIRVPVVHVLAEESKEED